MSDDELVKLAEELLNLPIDVAEAIGNPNMVWCRHCGRSQSVDAANCIRSGWPKCCGYTMTIDLPSLETETISAAR